MATGGSLKARAPGGPQPWWANQGHNRAMAERAAQLAKKRKKWSLAGCAMISWMLVYIGGASVFMLGSSGESDDASSVRAIGTKRHLAGPCRFYGPADGFLNGCAQSCRGFARLAPALHACAADSTCGGVTYVPWEREGVRFELRSGEGGSGPQMTSDGQISFVVESCEDRRAGWNPDTVADAGVSVPAGRNQQAAHASKPAASSAASRPDGRHQPEISKRGGLRQGKEETATPDNAATSGLSALAALEARLEKENGVVRPVGKPAQPQASEQGSLESDEFDAEANDDETQAELDHIQHEADEEVLLDEDALADADVDEDKGTREGKDTDGDEDPDEDDDNEDEDDQGVEASNQGQAVAGDSPPQPPPPPPSKRQAEPAKDDPFAEPFADAEGPLVVAERAEDPSFKIEFWTPPGVDLDDSDAVDAVGSFENDQPTIFVGIASYRDFMCADTLERALHWATHPERLRFGVAEQNAPIDRHCFDVKRPCDEDPGQLLCKYRRNIRVHKVSALDARGPTFGRHRADSLYRGEYFALQVDAHMYFVKGWDEDLVSQFESTGNEYAVLSTYPTDSGPRYFDEARAKSLSRTTPAICKSTIIGDKQMTKHGSAHEFAPPSDISSPILQTWWAAGVSFSRGHRILRVPYDCCLPMLFDGEETSMAYRAWTHGYDFYTFHHSVVFHPYNRADRPPLYWENQKVDRAARDRELQMSQRRLRKIFGLDPGGEYFDQEIERYGLGTRRPLLKFWKVFGVDYRKNRIRDQCKAATSGAIHRALVPFLRPDGKGIDYTQVRDDMNFLKAGKRRRKNRDAR